MIALGVAMIVRNEREDLPACLASLKGVADVLYVLDTGSTDGTPNLVSDFAKDNPAIKVVCEEYLEASEETPQGYVIQDFAKARNAVLERIYSMCTHVLVLDADDVLLDGALLKSYLQLEQDKIIGFQVVSPNDRISPFVSHRCWPASRGVKYIGKCHEYPDWGDCLMRINTSLKILHTDTPREGQERGLDRDLRILEAEYKSGDKSHRTLFYYARTLQKLEKYYEAAAVFNEYLVKPTDFWEERRLAHLYLTRCLRLWGNYHGAITAGWAGWHEDQRMSEIVMELAYCYKAMRQYDKAIGCAYLALQKVPDSVLWVERDKYELEPWRLIRECFLLRDRMK